MSRILRNIIWGVGFCLICVWGSYFTFENYVEQVKERETYHANLKNVQTKLEQIKLDADRELRTKDAEVQRVAQQLKSLENEQRELNEQIGFLRREKDKEKVRADELAKREPLCNSPVPPPECKSETKSDVASVSERGATSEALSRMRPVGHRPKHLLDLDHLSNFQGTKMHVISHTHWDREWYLPFETFRARLVRLLDVVVDRIDTDPDFKHFHLDGQMIPVDDFLQVREHMRDKLHIANIEGRIAMGPWYVQPDEFLVSAEALVRNLMLGIERATQMGGTSLVGYIPDSFGHIAQMPQLLLGFGIDSSVSGRGIPNNFGSTELWWEGPDGSRVLFIFLKRWYCNGLDMPSNEWGITSWFDRKEGELRSAGSKTSHLLLMNGCDHTAPDPNVGDLVVSANKKWTEERKDKIAVHSNIDDYIELVKRDIQRQGTYLEKWSGEMRVEIEGLTNTLSNKITQKQANWRLQNLLEQWVEPMETIAWKLTGRKYDHDSIWYAWRVLLENHPHDSICGCSDAEVHSEVDARFIKVRQVAEQLSTLSLMKVIGGLARRDQIKGRLFVWNPTNIPREGEVIFAEIETHIENGKVLIATDLDGNRVPAHALEGVNNIWSYELPDVGFRRPLNRNLVRIAIQVSVPPFGYQAYTCSWGQPTNEEEKPTALHVRTGSKEADKPADFHGMPADIEQNQRQRRLLSEESDSVEQDQQQEQVSENSETGVESESGWSRRRLLQASKDQEMENEHLLVRVGRDGQATIILKAANLEFARINRYEETGDSGDQYGYRRSGGGGGSTEHGTVVKEPRHFHTHSIIEADVRVSDYSVKVFYVLSRGSKRLDIRTEYDNRNHNHRLRAQFTAPWPIHLSHADSQFETITRPTSGYKFYPQMRYVMVHDASKTQGLLIANRGLPEYQVEGSTVSVTLIRSTDRIGDWGKFPVESAQEQGPNSYEYSVVPFAVKQGESLWGMADLEGRKFNDRLGAMWGKEVDGFVPEAFVDMSVSELQMFSTWGALGSSPQRKMPTSSSGIAGGLGDAPEGRMFSRSLLDIRPHHLVLSAVKKAEKRNSIIVRFFNPFESTENVEIYVSSALAFEKAYRCDINEDRKDVPDLVVETLDGGQKRIKLVAAHKKIVTIELA